MPIPNKRNHLARALGGLGVWRILERLGRRPGLIVFNYHRIGDPETDPYYRPLISATPERFRSQVEALQRSYPIVSPNEWDNWLARPDGPAVLITFDDAYRDQYNLAAPILKELGVPALFFVPTGYLDEPRLPWWDYVTWVFRAARSGWITTTVPRPLTLEATPESAQTLIDELVAARRFDEARLKAELAESAGVQVDEHAMGRDLFMTWDQVRELLAQGHGVGSHTVTHPALASLTSEGQEEELRQSRLVLEERLERPVSSVAYPYGTPEAVNETTLAAARRAGYRLGFTFTPSVVRPADLADHPLALGRVRADRDDGPALIRARSALLGAFGRSRL